MGEEVTDLARSHFRRVALVMKEYVLFDPSQVGWFGPDAVVPGANEVADVIEEFRLAMLFQKPHKPETGF